MKKLLIPMAATAAIAAAVPAAAQHQNQGWGTNARGGASLQTRIAQLETRIDAGVRAGSIDRREARQLRQEVRALARLERRYSRDGLNRQEQADLRARVRAFRDNLRLARGDDGDDRYAQGYPNDGNYGRGGPYEECVSRNDGGGGLFGGIIDSIFGGDDDEECYTGLRVGQRVSADLGGVPYHLRSRFRDGGGVYYRSDGQAVYQIDARTHTVIRIYDVD